MCVTSVRGINICYFLDVFFLSVYTESRCELNLTSWVNNNISFYEITRFPDHLGKSKYDINLMLEIIPIIISWFSSTGSIIARKSYENREFQIKQKLGFDSTM